MNSSRIKASPAQLHMLSRYMKANPKLAAGYTQNSMQGRADYDKCWLKLVNQLNALGGTTKTVTKWKQTWRDLKNNLKKKLSHNTTELRDHVPGNTENEISKIIPLSSIDEQVLSVMGPVVVHGIEVNISDASETITPDVSPNHAKPESELSNSPVSTPEKTQYRKRFTSRLGPFYSRLIKIEQEKIKIKRERNLIEKNKVSALNRIADILHQISN